MIDVTPFIVSLKLAATVTLFLFVVSVPIAYALAFTRVPAKPLVESVVMLPIVLPPTVLGFYFLVVFAPASPIGAFFERTFGLSFLFSFHGIVFASSIAAIPFMVEPLKNGMLAVPSSIINASYTLGKSKAETFFRITLPNMRPAIITALLMTFAKVMGSFGVVLMVGGSVPRETYVASIAIYEKVESLDYASAHVYALSLVGISFAVILVANVLNRSREKRSVR